MSIRYQPLRAILAITFLALSSHLSFGVVPSAAGQPAPQSAASGKVPQEGTPGVSEPVRLRGAEGAAIGRVASKGGGAGRAPGSRGRLSEARCELIISVVGDIAPDWAQTLQAQYAEDPVAFGESIRPHARRLTGLGMLRDRNPELYALRVAELALKRGLREKAIEYHRVLARDPESPDLIAMESTIRELAKESVDLELRARAMELAALAEAVKEMKNLLLQETTVRSARIDALADELLAVPPKGPSFEEAMESLSSPSRPSRSGRRSPNPPATQVESPE